MLKNMYWKVHFFSFLSKKFSVHGKIRTHTDSKYCYISRTPYPFGHADLSLENWKHLIIQQVIQSLPMDAGSSTILSNFSF